jgi:hypothetical protein
MSKYAWTYLVGIASVAVSCATFPPPEERKPEADQDLLSGDDTGTTAEWLFVTSEGGSGKGKDACGLVAQWLDGEKQCTGEICVHARDLGKEWLQRCKKEAGDRLSAVQDLVDTFEERAELPPDACVQEGTGMLRTHACGEPEACEAQAQRWISHCGASYATPLFVLMLTRTLQRRFPDDPNKPAHEVKFDTRSCNALAEAVAKGVGCDGAECDTSVEAGEAWMDRCRKPEEKMPLALAFQLADVRVGGGRGVDPMAVHPLENKLADGSFPLLLSDHKGVVSWVCGVRPKNLEGYLKARRECASGEVIVARVDGQRSVRTASVPHADDATFARQFPFLEVKGEREVRAMAELGAFQQEVAEAVTQAQGRRPEEAVASLARALRTRDQAVIRQAAYQKVLTDADRELVPAFKEWGKHKVRGVTRARGAEEQGLYARRALQNPLHDMARDGTVSAGAYIAPPSFTLDRWMPLSFLAYKDELSALQRTADRHNVSGDRVAQLRQEVVSEVSACAQAETRVQTANDAVMACMLGEGCTQDKITSLASAADPDRERAQRSRDKVARILASGLFSRGEMDRLDAERISGGCLDP